MNTKKGLDKPFAFLTRVKNYKKNTGSSENSYPYSIIYEQFR